METQRICFYSILVALFFFFFFLTVSVVVSFSVFSCARQTGPDGVPLE